MTGPEVIGCKLSNEEKFIRLRKLEFVRLKNHVYLDQAGSALYTNSHIKKYHEELERNLFGNPHTGNSCSDKTSDIIYQVRLAILQRFNVTLNEYDVIFTSGTTQSLKLAGECFEWSSGSIYAYTQDNHTSVVGIREIATEKGASSYCVTCQDDLPNLSAPQFHAIPVKQPSPNRSSDVDKHPSCLFAFPAQSNFSGFKYPLSWIDYIHDDRLNSINFPVVGKRKWYVLCDAAAFVPTSNLDLQLFKPDFVSISFYKMFGFPTGLGALLVRKEAEDTLRSKKYFGGGAVTGWLATHDYHSPKPILHDRFEDGTVSFLSILALKLGFDTFSNLGLDINSINIHTNKLWEWLHKTLAEMKHENGQPIVETYTRYHGADISNTNQGPILAFNIKRPDGSYVGYNHVLHLANNNNIFLRGGCFCNIGACTSLIKTKNEVLLAAFESGHVCGDSIDLIDGKPIGALRVSLGPHSSIEDVNQFINFLLSCFKDAEILRYSDDQKLKRTDDIILEEIILYPIKSCQGMSVKTWEISETGLKYDRMWMIVDEYGVPITLKKNPHLISIYPEVDPVREILVLRAEGMEDIEVPFLLDTNNEMLSDLNMNEQCMSKVCGDTVSGLNCGEAVSLWLSELLCIRCILLQKNMLSQRFPKKISPSEHTSNALSLVNEAQFLLINRTSVEYLYHRMIESGDWEKGVENEDIANITKRFRGNLVISGGAPFCEDQWTNLAAISNGDENDVKFSKCGLCNRCNVICVDPDSGQKLDGPLKILANVLPSKSDVRRKPTFGVYLQCNHKTCLISAPSKLKVH